MKEKQHKAIMANAGVISGIAFAQEAARQSALNNSLGGLQVPDRRPIETNEGKIVDFRGNAMGKTAELIKTTADEKRKARGKVQHDIAEQKIRDLVLKYLGLAKADSLGSKIHFKKCNNEWETFATIKNKQQRDIQLHMNAFEKNVEFFLENARQQLEAKHAELLNQSNESETKTEEAK